MEMESYYKCRKAIRELYKHDTDNGDLYSRIFELRDKYRYVTSVSIETENYSIYFELADGTSQDKINNLKAQILSRISEYLISNKDNIDIEDKNYLSLFLANNNFCDFYIVGNSIHVNL